MKWECNICLQGLASDTQDTTYKSYTQATIIPVLTRFPTLTIETFAFDFKVDQLMEGETILTMEESTPPIVYIKKDEDEDQYYPQDERVETKSVHAPQVLMIAKYLNYNRVY